jgi:hypothetical protein
MNATASFKWTSAVVTLLAMSLFVGCGGHSEQATATDSPATATTASAVPSSESMTPVTPAAPQVTCANVLGRIKGDKPGSMAPIPADFPAPPPGSTLCGETFMHEVWYLNTTTADNDLLDYYRKELTAKGYSVDPVSHSSGGDQRIDFQRGHTVTGYVATVGDKDSMSRKFKDVVKIAYHTIP